MNRRLVGLSPALLVVVGLSAASLAGLVSRSTRPGALVDGERSLDAWRRVLSDENFWSAAWFTSHTAVLATLLSVLLAVPLGIALRRSGRLARMSLLILLPMPHLVMASVAVSWLGPGRLVDRLVGEVPVVGDRWGLGIVLVYMVKEVPFLAVLTAAALDPATRRLEDAASSLGASRWHRWRFIVLPRLATPLSLGVLVIAAFVIGSTEVPLVVGPLQPEMLTTHSLTITRLRGPVARADAAVVLLVTSVWVMSLAALGLFVARRLTWLRGSGAVSEASDG